MFRVLIKRLSVAVQILKYGYYTDPYVQEDFTDTFVAADGPKHSLTKKAIQGDIVDSNFTTHITNLGVEITVCHLKLSNDGIVSGYSYHSDPETAKLRAMNMSLDRLLKFRSFELAELSHITKKMREQEKDRNKPIQLYNEKDI